MENKDALIASPQEKIPIGRSTIPEEIASLGALLVSAETGFVNGVDLAVDGEFLRVRSFVMK